MELFDFVEYKKAHHLCCSILVICTAMAGPKRRVLVDTTFTYLGSTCSGISRVASRSILAGETLLSDDTGLSLQALCTLREKMQE